MADTPGCGGQPCSVALNLARLSLPPPHCGRPTTGSAVSGYREHLRLVIARRRSSRARPGRARMGRAYVIGMAVMFRASACPCWSGVCTRSWLAVHGATLLIGWALGHRWAGALARWRFSDRPRRSSSHLIRPEAGSCARACRAVRGPPRSDARLGASSGRPRLDSGETMITLPPGRSGETVVWDSRSPWRMASSSVPRGVGLGLCLWGMALRRSAPAVGATAGGAPGSTAFGHAGGAGLTLLANLATMPAFFWANYRTWGGPLACSKPRVRSAG
jgi:hypothetical protein